MNGRLYDPRIHRFLQPDNNLQEPYNTQNYNRYGYVLNNPLRYTDPSGENFWDDFVAGVAIVAGVVLTVASVGTLASVGVALIGAGVTHFGVAASNYFSTGSGTQGDWNASSTKAGINFSTSVSTDFGYGGKKDVANNNNVVESHGYVGSNSQIESNSSLVEYANKKYDVNRKMNLNKHIQDDGSMVCTYVEKLIADEYFSVTGHHEINRLWYNEVKGVKGLKLNEVIPHYKNSNGYIVNEYIGPMDNGNAIPWMAEEMRLGRIVQVNIGTQNMHNVSVIELKYMYSGLDNVIQLNNYIRMRGISSAVQQIYSVWHP